MSESHVIRTPDQRLRIFVSSTLEELASERKAARTAIERLRLAPVMFELGARPHPPRELYRAYLQQSDVFLGLYWERYGWVAPDETVSGLEDEYNLCPPELPRLLYVKRPVGEREPRLKELLDRIRNDDRAAYKYFESPKELARLVEADLVTLLAERFEQSRVTLAAAAADDAETLAEPIRLPTSLTQLIGRDADVEAIRGMLASGTRFLTLIGPGGIGKTRLAVAAARAAASSFEDGTAFVDLSAVQNPDRVPYRIAQAIGVYDTGDTPIEENLITALRDRQMLLVLDNFEQILSAGPELTSLLAATPGVSALITSRTLLRVNGEHSYDVGPLVEQSSVNLFVERARAVKPDFELTPSNAQTIARICTALDGAPLAIELAAARIRVLSPADLLQRLDRRLSVLVGGSRDLPERQQTIRRTIEWSAHLLDDRQRRLLARLGVFADGFTLEAAESVGADEDADADVLSDLAALVDGSLVRQHDGAERPRFSLQAIVREYALERLAASDDLPAAREAHACYFLRLAERCQAELKGARQREWLRQLGDDRDNLRVAELYLLESRDWSRAARLPFTLYLYWWVSGLLGEVRTWMDRPLDSGDELDDLTKAIALYFTRTIMFWKDPDGSVVADLTQSAELFNRASEPNGEGLARISIALALLASQPSDNNRARTVMEPALELFRSSGNRWGESMALVILGRVALLQHKTADALAQFEQSLAITQSAGDVVGERIASYHCGWAHLFLDDVASARADFTLSVRRSASIGHLEGLAYGLEGLAAIAAIDGNADRAGRLAGAARGLRERSGTHNGPTFTFHQTYLDQLAASGAGGQVDAAIAIGRELSVEQAVFEALATA